MTSELTSSDGEQVEELADTTPDSEPTMSEPANDLADELGDPALATNVAAAKRPKSTGTRRRLKQAGVVVGVAALAGAAGVVIGTRIKSPADAASEREAPVASLITVPVEMRQ